MNDFYIVGLFAWDSPVCPFNIELKFFKFPMDKVACVFIVAVVMYKMNKYFKLKNNIIYLPLYCTGKIKKEPLKYNQPQFNNN